LVDLIEKAVQDLSPGTSQFKVLCFLAFRGASQPSAISDETRIPAGTVRPALRSLLEKGYVRQQEDGTYRSMISFTDVISHLYSQGKK
jgi:DNA-binding IclR family transcriptional regulator